MTGITLLYVTCRDGNEAKSLAKELFEKKLIACANMFAMESMYEWEGKLNEESEVVLLLKTEEDKSSQAKEEIKARHSYNVPCILELKADANQEYADWLQGQLK